MPDDKPKSNTLKQVLVAVLITLLAGGSAPWWVQKIFDHSTDHTNQDTTISVDHGPGDAGLEVHSLPGDSVIAIKVLDAQGLRLTLSVVYSYNAQHAGHALVGAFLEGVKGRSVPKPLGPKPKGVVMVPITVESPGSSSEITISLFDMGHPQRPFARRTFPLVHHFGG